MTGRLAVVARLAAIVVAVLGAAGLASGTATAAVHPNTVCSGSAGVNHAIGAGGYFSANTYICSGNYEFINQQDGNLVIYNGSGTPIWASHTQRGLPSDLYMNPHLRTPRLVRVLPA